MSRELTFQNYVHTGKTLYAFVDFEGLRWNGAAFVAPTAAGWSGCAVPMTEDAGTGHFTADVPAAIDVWGRLEYHVFIRADVTPSPTDTAVWHDQVIWSGDAESAYDVRRDPAVMAWGRISAATSSTATLGSWGPAVDIGGKASMTVLSGTGAGQSARITSYDTATRVAGIENAWLVTPDATSTAAVTWVSEWRVALTPAGLDAIDVSAPTGTPTSLPKMLVRLYRRFFSKATQTSAQLKTYADDGVTVLTVQTLGDDGTTLTQSAAS